MDKRTARCACGRLRVSIAREPLQIVACHCDFCQKRTGSAFYVGAFYIRGDDFEISGETKIYNGVAANGVGTVAGDDVSFFFCPTCGSTVFYIFKGRPIVGIAVGSFVDPSFPTPTVECHVGMRHGWLSPIPSAEQCETYPDR